MKNRPWFLPVLFVDPDHGDHPLRDDAPVFGALPDFTPLSPDNIGRY